MPNSASVIFLQAGTYYWQAIYSGDANNSSAASVCASEPITVTPNSPTITTSLVTVSPQVALATITTRPPWPGRPPVRGGRSPTACIRAVARRRGGRQPVDSVTAGVTDGNVANGTFTGVAAGIYELQAVYTGDANNNGATSTCGTEPFTVTQTSPTLETALSAATAAIGIPVHDYGHLGRGDHRRRGDGDLHRLHRQRL